jgi:hypothetical protein
MLLLLLIKQENLIFLLDIFHKTLNEITESHIRNCKQASLSHSNHVNTIKHDPFNCTIGVRRFLLNASDYKYMIALKTAR